MRWIVRFLGVFLSLAVLTVAALFLIPAERIAGMAADRFESVTGRALTIGGSVRPSVWPVIGARVEDVRVANAAWSDAGPMFVAEAVDLGLDLRALIGGDIVVTRLEAVAPRILLERNRDGVANWDFAGVGEPGEENEAGRSVSLSLAEVSGGALRFRDHQAGLELELDDLDLELRLPELAGPGTLQARGRSNGQAFAALLQVGNVRQLLEGAVAPASLALDAGGNTLRFEGRAGLDPLAADGRLAVEGEGLAPLLRLAGQGGDEPLPPNARPFGLDGQVTLAPSGSLHLRDGQFRAGSLRATAALDLTLDDPRPRLSGEIATQSLDLAGFPGEGLDGEGPDPGTGWSREAIDASPVGYIDADLTLRAEAVETPVGRIAPFRAGLNIDRARAVFDLRELRFQEGRVSGEFVINNRAGLSVGGNLRLEEIALLPLMYRLTGYEWLTGSGTASLRFLGVGQTMDAIMRSLSGEGELELDQGEIVGLDIVGMLRNLDMSYVGERNRTIYDRLTGSFNIDGGVLRNDDLRIDARSLTAEGRGTVDLGERSLDYRLIPTALRDPQTGRTLRVPLHVTGPWEAPRFRLDLEGLAEERLREERARIEERARDEIERRLGIERQEGQSGREALREGARQRLEEEIGRGLQRLLGNRD